MRAPLVLYSLPFSISPPSVGCFAMCFVPIFARDFTFLTCVLFQNAPCGHRHSWVSWIDFAPFVDDSERSFARAPPNSSIQNWCAPTNQRSCQSSFCSTSRPLLSSQQSFSKSAALLSASNWLCWSSFPHTLWLASWLSAQLYQAKPASFARLQVGCASWQSSSWSWRKGLANCQMHCWLTGRSLKCWSRSTLASRWLKGTYSSRLSCRLRSRWTSHPRWLACCMDLPSRIAMLFQNSSLLQ